jgi:hypothetical protein
LGRRAAGEIEQKFGQGVNSIVKRGEPSASLIESARLAISDRIRHIEANEWQLRRSNHPESDFSEGICRCFMDSVSIAEAINEDLILSCVDSIEIESFPDTDEFGLRRLLFGESAAGRAVERSLRSIGVSIDRDQIR